MLNRTRNLGRGGRGSRGNRTRLKDVIGTVPLPKKISDRLKQLDFVPDKYFDDQQHVVVSRLRQMQRNGLVARYTSEDVARLDSILASVKGKMPGQQ